MIDLGRYNQLKVVKKVDFGMYLDGGEDGEILLPTKYIPQGTRVGDVLNVFLYLDQEERLIATTQEPLAQVGDFAYLEVAWVNEYGAFLNWGLMKDLFVPFREQKLKMRKGQKYIVHVHEDAESYRIMASAKVEHYLSKEKPTYKPGEEVNILIWQHTDLGYKVIVDNTYAGLLYTNEIFQHIEVGMRLSAYVKQVREDGKIDIRLQQQAKTLVPDFSTELLQYIKDNGGYTALNDKSDAQLIYDTFGVSKKIFKKAVGDLYKKRLITLSDKGIEVVK